MGGQYVKTMVFQERKHTVWFKCKVVHKMSTNFV